MKSPSRVLGFGRGQLRDYKPARARTRKPPSRISKSSKKATGASLMADLMLRCRRLMIRCRRRCSRRLRRASRERMLLASAMNLCASCKSEKLYLSECLKMCSANGRRFSESGSTCSRPLLSDLVSRDLLGEPKAPNLNNCQIGEAALIRAQTIGRTIGRTEPHPEIAMKDKAERFPTVVTSHGFNMRRTSLLALHLRCPRFPDYAKPTPKPSAGSK
jgi:hypothetical protein